MRALCDLSGEKIFQDIIIWKPLRSISAMISISNKCDEVFLLHVALEVSAGAASVGSTLISLYFRKESVAVGPVRLSQRVKPYSKEKRGNRTRTANVMREQSSTTSILCQAIPWSGLDGSRRKKSSILILCALEQSILLRKRHHFPKKLSCKIGRVR